MEGELVNELQRVGFDYDGILLNAAAYTHTSVAIGDAISAIRTPVIEIHISNVASREEFRPKSLISAKSCRFDQGLGLKGYELGFFIFYKNTLIIRAKPLSCFGPSVSLMICRPLFDHTMNTSPFLAFASCLSMAGMILPRATHPKSPL